MTAELAAGVSAAAIAVMAGVCLRISSAPIAIKIVMPALAVATAAIIPWLEVSLADTPKSLSLDNLGQCFTIRAFAANDDEGTVDVWLIGTGRIVRLPLSKDLKDVLKAAREALSKQTTVRICREPPPKGEKSGDPGAPNAEGGSQRMQVDRNLFGGGKPAR